MTDPLTEVEFDVWATKPRWCQPWSISLTAFGVIGASWWLWHRFWVTSAVAIPMLSWMIYFVMIYPRLVRRLYDQARSPGGED